MGNAIVDAMFPGVGGALRMFDDGLVNRIVQAATGIDFAGLQRHVTESAAQRHLPRDRPRGSGDPRRSAAQTGDPVLIGSVLSGRSRLEPVAGSDRSALQTRARAHDKSPSGRSSREAAVARYSWADAASNVIRLRRGSSARLARRAGDQERG